MADISSVKLQDNQTYYFKDNSAIVSISRSGNTYTATRHDGTTFEFTQKDDNTTYTFEDGVNSFTVTPSNGTAQTVTVTPSIPNATQSSDGLMSATDKTKLDGVANGAEVNQNAFSNVAIGASTISADSKTDTLTLVGGANITLTPDATNDKITILLDDTVDTGEVIATDIQAGNLIVNGTSRFLNTINGTASDSEKLNGQSLTSTYSSTGTAPITGAAVASAIGALDGTVTGSPSASKTLTAFSQTDGKVSATFGNISITKSQVSDFPTLGTAAAKNYTTSVSSGSADLVTSGAVWTAIDNLPEPMVFKGSLGTGGTITALPVDGTAKVGDTYKVITAGTYASKAAKVGDTFICLTKTSSANTWELIPSGDEPSGTVTSVGISNGGGLSVSGSPITSSGTITISHSDTSSQAPVSNSGRTYIQSITLDTYGHVTKLTSATETVTNTDRYVNSAAFAHDSTNDNVKMTLTRAGSDTATVTANIPKVSNSSAGVAPKGATVSSQSQTTKFLREDGTWQAPSYTPVIDNLTSSTSTTSALSAKQGYLLANGSARDNTKLPLAGGQMTGDIIIPKNDNMGIKPNTNNYGEIGHSNLYFYRSFITHYYGTTSHVANWDSNGNIGSPATSSAASTRGYVNFYNTCAAGGTQTKTTLYAHTDADANTNILLPKNSGTLITNNDICPTVLGTNSYGVTTDNSSKKIKIKINPTNYWMLCFVVTLYQSYDATRIMISGYNYNTTHWYQPLARVLGSTKTGAIKVYFGYDADTELWVGFDGASYTGITIDSVTNGYQQITDYKDTFTISFEDSLTTLQDTKTVYRPWYRDETVDLSTKTNILNGFNNGGAGNITWGNQTGTGIWYNNDANGGSVGFRTNNPASGQVSMVIDGTVYIKEGAQDVSAAVKSFSVSGQTVTYTNLWGGTGTFTTQDTKNTAGSTDTSSKIFLIGATSQAANPQTYSDDQVYVTSGTLQTNNTYATVSLCANTGNSGTAGGISLYGSTPTTYGIAMRGTGNGGKHGYVQGDWAIYNYMSSGTTRGWVYRYGNSTNVASISCEGHIVTNGSLTLGGNATNTSGVRQVYNETTKSLDFVFVA